MSGENDHLFYVKSYSAKLLIILAEGCVSG